MSDELARWKDAYDRLFHRASAAVPDVTRGLPTPHELRTGETPDAVAAACLERRQAREART